MAIFTLFWKDGRAELVEGNTIAQALASRGYSFTEHGILLEMFSQGDLRNACSFDTHERTWKVHHDRLNVKD